MSYIIRIKHLAIFLVLLGILSCASEKAQSDMEIKSLQGVSVDSVKVIEMMPDKGEIVISIKGILPNPAYEIKKIETRIDKGKIQIIPHVYHDPNKVVIQMMIPYEKKVVVSGLKKKKKYEIKVANKVYVKKVTLRSK